MDVVKTFSVLSGLSSVHRYSMMKLGNPESVLEHTGMVTILANLIAREINLILDKPYIDISTLTLKAIVHDVDELVVGDIPRPTKYFSHETRDMFRVIEDRGVRKVMSEMALSPALQAIAIEAHAESKIGVDGFIVALADAMAVVYKVWEEVIVRNNLSMVRQSMTVKKQLNSLLSTAKLTFVNEYGVVKFISSILSDCFSLMEEASRRDLSIIGAIREEMIE